MKRRRLALILLLLPSWAPAAAEGEDFDFEGLGKAAIPFAGYDDKTGWIFGGAGFLYSEKEPGINSGLFAISNLDNFHSATFNHDQRGKGPWSFGLHLLGERAFDHYYGEGDLTPYADPLFMRLYHFEVEPAAYYRPRPKLRLGAFGDFRSRLETDTQYFPNEGSASWGLRVEWDSRDKLINTRRGALALLELGYNPAGFGQASVDLRHFQRLKRGLTLASRFTGGISAGHPSYLFRYRLGGLDLLRGYKDNRFRGEDYFVVQEELRWILKRWLSINVSVDLAGIKDEAFHQLKASAQAGLRIGLPPDWGQKMRVELGYGADQSTFQIQFGEIF